MTLQLRAQDGVSRGWANLAPLTAALARTRRIAGGILQDIENLAESQRPTQCQTDTRVGLARGGAFNLKLTAQRGSAL